MLTERQLQILRLACFTNGQIAVILGLAESTVKNHYSAIYRVLCPEAGKGGHKRCLAVMRAIQRGLLDVHAMPSGSWASFSKFRQNGEEV